MKILLFICISVVIQNSIAASSAEGVYHKYARSVVLIKNKFGGKGTGLQIAPNIIITNRHVVFGPDAKYEFWNAPAEFHFSDGQVVKQYEHMVCSKNIDVCSIVIEGHRLDQTSLSFSERAIRPGEDVFVIGHPKGLKSPVISSGIVSSEVSKILWNDLDEKKTTFEGYAMTAPISKGSSGSPVFSVEGEVLGIAVGSLRDSQNLNYVITAAELNLFLAQVAAKDIDRVSTFSVGFEDVVRKQILEKKNKIVRGEMVKNVPRFRSCYQNYLDQSELMAQGSLILKFTVGSNGFVSSSEVSSKVKLPAVIKNCAQKILKSLSFKGLPERGETVIVQPINFVIVSDVSL